MTGQDDRAAVGEGNGDVMTEKIRGIGRDLAETLRMVINAIPGSPHRPTEFAQRLGLSRVISSRLLSSTAKADPFEVAHLIPGPESLRSLLRAAVSVHVSGELIDEAESAVRRFERLIRDDFGTRSALDAVISSNLPDARERFESAGRYSVFKGMSQLLGVEAEVWVTSMLLHPTASDAGRLDVAPIHGALGMRRMRPDVPVHFSFGMPAAKPEAECGEDVAGGIIGLMSLERFYTHAPAQLEVSQESGVVAHSLVGDQYGRQFLVDMLAADHHVAVIPHYGDAEGGKKRGTSVVPDIPVKALVYDVLLHRDVFPQTEPILVVHNIGLRGRANVNDPTRDIDRIETRERIEYLGDDLRRFHAGEIPNYVRMLEQVCEVLGWDARGFRGYRCRIQYPVYGWQISMAFDPPARRAHFDAGRSVGA